MKRYFFLVILFIICTKTDAQISVDSTISTANYNDSLLYKRRQKWIIAGLATQQVASYYLEYKWWWEGNYHKFNVNSDGGFNNYSLGLDKVGHFYTSYMFSNALRELFTWGHFSNRTTNWVSVAIPFAWALSIEIGDGFSRYEFSPGDLTANTLGIAYALAQHKVPVLRNFNFKFSYFPGSYFSENNFKGWSLTADYDGHIYWLSTDIHGLLSEKYKKHWPAFLNLALGYGINNFSESFYYGKNYVKQREFFIGLDYNLRSLKAKNETRAAVRNILDYYHYPAPGIKKTGDENWKLKPLLLN